MNDFERFKQAVALLNKHCQLGSCHEDVAKRLIADRDNEFHGWDFLAYISDLDNTIQAGLSAVLDATDPGIEEQD